jgi:hypothetical protein
LRTSDKIDDKSIEWVVFWRENLAFVLRAEPDRIQLEEPCPEADLCTLSKSLSRYPGLFAAAKRRGTNDYALLPSYGSNSSDWPDIQWKGMQGKMGMRLHSSVLSGLQFAGVVALVLFFDNLQGLSVAEEVIWRT